MIDWFVREPMRSKINTTNKDIDAGAGRTWDARTDSNCSAVSKPAEAEFESGRANLGTWRQFH
jgi:hypothetical protein